MGEYKYKVEHIDEDFFENAIIEYLTNNLDYEHLYGPDVARTTIDYKDVFLPGELSESLTKINPDLPPQAITEAILKLNNVEGGKLEHRNEIFTDHLQNGVEVRFYDGKEERDDIVKLIDYDNVENNKFHVVNQ